MISCYWLSLIGCHHTGRGEPTFVREVTWRRRLREVWVRPRVRRWRRGGCDRGGQGLQGQRVVLRHGVGQVVQRRDLRRLERRQLQRRWPWSGKGKLDHFLDMSPVWKFPPQCCQATWPANAQPISQKFKLKFTEPTYLWLNHLYQIFNPACLVLLRVTHIL